MQAGIAILIINLSSGGAERLLVHTIPEYVKHGVPIKIYLLNGSKNKADYVSALEKYVDIEILSNYHANNPIHIIKLRKVLKREKIVHVHLFPVNLWLVLSKFLFRSKAIIINTEHGIVNKSFMKKWHIKKLVQFIYNRFDYHIAISKNIAKKIEKLTRKPDRIVQINNGIDVQRVTQAQAIPKQDIYEELDIPTNSVLLLMTARFHEQKKQKDLIDVLTLLDNKIHVLFLGEGKLLEDTKQYALDQNLQSRVHFLGFRANAVHYMKSVDINILFSNYEGLSGAVVEALSSGRPFLGSNVPGINDVVEDERYLFSDKQELADKINTVINESDFTQQMVQDGLEHVRMFDLKNMLDQHIKFYKSLIHQQ